MVKRSAGTDSRSLICLPICTFELGSHMLSGLVVRVEPLRLHLFIVCKRHRLIRRAYRSMELVTVFEGSEHLPNRFKFCIADRSAMTRMSVVMPVPLKDDTKTPLPIH